MMYGKFTVTGFQSSFELTGYITKLLMKNMGATLYVSKLFRAYGLYNIHMKILYILQV